MGLEARDTTDDSHNNEWMGWCEVHDMTVVLNPTTGVVTARSRHIWELENHMDNPRKRNWTVEYAHKLFKWHSDGYRNTPDESDTELGTARVPKHGSYGHVNFEDEEGVDNVRTTTMTGCQSGDRFKLVAYTSLDPDHSAGRRIEARPVPDREFTV